MPAVITCPSCERRLLLAAMPDGKTDVRCSSCGMVFQPHPDGPSSTGRPARRELKDSEMISAEPLAPLPEPLRSPVDEQPILDALPAAPPPRNKRLLVAGILAPVALCGLLMGIAGRGFWNAPRAPITDDPDQRQQDIRAAFAGGEPIVGEDAEAIQAALKSLGEAFTAGDARLIGDHFDPERMFDEFVAQDAVPRGARSNRSASVREIRRGLGQSLARQSSLMAWNATEIRSIRRLGDREAIVISRHRNAAGDTLKHRWFFCKQSGQWRIYDYEDLDVGLRMSTLMGSVMQEDPGRMQELSRASFAIREAVQALVEEDADKAEGKLKQAEGIRLPRPMEAVRLMATAKLYMQRDRMEDAIEALHKARKLQPGMPVLDLLEGLALNHLGKWDQALPLLETYRDLLGEDDVVGAQLGLALRGVRRFSDAAVSYRKALDYNPKNADAFLGLLLSLEPKSKRDDLAARFARLDKPHENLEVIFEELEAMRDAASLEQIALGMQQVDPKLAEGDYYLALARAWAGKGAEALPPFKAALQKEKDAGRRKSYAQGFYQAMEVAGKAEEAYSGAPDPLDAFAILAPELKKGFRTAELEDLVVLHGKRHPKDPWLPLYQGEVFVADEDYARAELAFAAGLAKVPADANLEVFRHSRVLARYHTGRPLSAYEDIGPQHATFEQLANLLLADRKYDLLQKLLDMHTRNDAADPQIPRFSYRLKLRQDKLADAVAIFNTVLAKQVEADGKREVLHEFLRDMIDLGKPVEGYRESPDASDAFLFLAEELQEQDKHDELPRLIAAHRAKQPDDVQLYLYESLALEQKEQWALAAQTLGEGWKKAGPDMKNRFRYRYVYALYKTGKVMEAYHTVGPRKETFHQLANLLVMDKRAADLEALVAAYLPEAKDDDQLPFVEVRAKILLKRPEEAIARFNVAKLKSEEQWREGQFIREMHGIGKGFEAYRAVPDRKAGFDALAAILLQEKKEEDLSRLLREHAGETTRSALYAYYLGEVHAFRGELVEANRLLSEAWANCDPNNQWRVREGLNRVRVRLGKTVETYQEFRDQRGVFETLARICVDENNARQLQELVLNRRATHPDDSKLAAWDLEILWLNKDHAGIVKLVKDQQTGPLSRARHQWKRDDYLIRSLIRLNRAKEAVAVAQEAVKDRHGSVLWLVYAHAAQGNVMEAIAAMPTGSSAWPRPEDCYRDADLGPVLRTDGMREFRAKFPEPMELKP